MRYSEFFIPTAREAPADAEVISHKLMVRAGMIRKLASGIYSYLPLGLRVIRKVEAIVREEMNRAGALEVMLPMVQPAELWQESGRWEQYGRELLRLRDRHERDFCLGPTHEEVITDLVRNEVKSYRQLPKNLYQIQTKFRDEIRPRFGVMRCREFGMKDAYSFDGDESGAEESYRKMFAAYQRIFSRCGLKFRAVEADSGSIGGSFSHEFMVLAESGEDSIIHCLSCDYAANRERAETIPPALPEGTAAPLQEVHTPQSRTVAEVAAFLGLEPAAVVKTLIYAVDDKVVAVLVRGDQEINEIKLKSYLGATNLLLADEETVKKHTGASRGFSGAVGLKIKTIADFSVAPLHNFVLGANKDDHHLVNVNFNRDLARPDFADLRFITASDPCPRCGRKIDFARGIEVGHVFKLGTKYSRALGCVYLDDQGREQTMVMGCYGIGIGRTVAAAIEQNHDARGIAWPLPIAPFDVVLLAVNINDGRQREAAEALYGDLSREGLEVLFDDRDERAGVKFMDADLIGIPWRINVGAKSLQEGKVELVERRTGSTLLLPIGEVVPSLIDKLRA